MLSRIAVAGLAFCLLAGCGSTPFQCHYNGGSGSGGACTLHFACGTTEANQMREVDCTPASGGGFTCTCVNAGVVEKTFTSTNLCPNLGNTSAVESAANVGCGWPMTSTSM